VNRLLRRARDHAEVHGDGTLNAASVNEAMTLLEIDELGLDAADRRLLAAIVQKFGGGPVGVAALGAVLAEEPETVEDVYEPFLMRLGFLDRTPQGRVATDRARAHLVAHGYDVPPRRVQRDPGIWDAVTPDAGEGATDQAADPGPVAGSDVPVGDA
jgi:Holliday junction resolvasome RuvABC ATP-dependent DNA helicase subunit